MNDFLVSVRNGTAPDRLSRAQFVHLAASDMTSLPDGEKLSRVGKRVDGLVSLKLGGFKTEVQELVSRPIP